MDSRFLMTLQVTVGGAQKIGNVPMEPERLSRSRAVTSKGRDEDKVIEGARGLCVGDRVTVKLLSTDVERGYIDFAA